MFRLIVVLALLGCALAGVIEPRKSDAGRIVGGEETTIEKFPYQVALIRNGELDCGGSLISPSVVVTAAHCLQSRKASDLKVRLGSSTYKSGGELISVSTIKFNENYDDNLTIYDVGLVKLSTPVHYTDKIRPIPLATEIPKTGTPAYVTGWGTDRYSHDDFQSVLHEAEVKIIDRPDCRSDQFKYGTLVGYTMVCAAVVGGGKDACQGDSGGPLAVGGRLVGIVSWGNMCAHKDYPGVYAAVPELRSWIENNAEQL